MDNTEEVLQDSNSIKAELSKMTFEELQKLKEKIGSKVYNEAMYGAKTVHKGHIKRLNKNRPREVSSKIKPFVQPLVTKHKQARDPRFDSLCGSYDDVTFKKNYKFLSRLQQKEKNDIKEKLKTEKDPQEIEKMKFVIQRLENKEREEAKKIKKREEAIKQREEKILLLKEGKKPHFRTKYEKKVAGLIDKFSDLKKSGKLKKHLEKQRKKSNTKSRKAQRYFEFDQ